MSTTRFKREAMIAAFDAAAVHYDAAAFLQWEVATRLLGRLPTLKLAPRHVVDLGAGTGRATVELAAKYGQARITALDIAPQMLHQTLQRKDSAVRCLVGDARQLPLREGSVDLLFSNLMLQWISDPGALFAELRRVLRPGGALLFSSFGPDTLKELRSSFAVASPYTHINRFVDLHDLGDLLLGHGFADPVTDVDTITVRYADARTLMRDLKAVGAHNVNHDRPRGLFGARRMQQVIAAYEGFRREGRLPASYEIIYGIAWAPDHGQPRRTPEGEIASIPTDKIGRI